METFKQPQSLTFLRYMLFTCCRCRHPLEQCTSSVADCKQLLNARSCNNWPLSRQTFPEILSRQTRNVFPFVDRSAVSCLLPDTTFYTENSTNFVYGTYVNISCKPGFQSSVNDSWLVTQCQRDRSWSIPPLNCSRENLRHEYIFLWIILGRVYTFNVPIV